MITISEARVNSKGNIELPHSTSNFQALTFGFDIVVGC
jgi:hypothetical protein